MLSSLVRLIVVISVIYYLDLGFCCSANPAGRGLPTENATICEADEHANITLTFPYPVNPTKPPQLLEIYLRNGNRQFQIIYEYSSRRVEDPPYTHESYTGRLLCDPELAWVGQVLFLLMELRPNDTGEYRCEVNADGKTFLRTIHLNVMASRGESTGETSEPPDRKERKRYGVGASLLLFPLVTVMFALRYRQAQTRPPET